MWLINELVKAVATKNEITLNGGVTIGLVDGGVKVKGEISTTIQERSDSTIIATMVVPMSAQVSVGELVIPVRVPQK